MPVKKILLELRVEENGEMTLERTGDKVTGRALGEPRRIGVVSDPQNSGEDIFTERKQTLQLYAPGGANAYSPGRTWDGSNQDTSPFAHEDDKGTRFYFQTVQYFRLGPKSIALARRRIG